MQLGSCAYGVIMSYGFLLIQLTIFIYYQVKRFLLREYDGYKSHLSEKYPEADGTYGLQLRAKQRAEAEAQEQE